MLDLQFPTTDEKAVLALDLATKTGWAVRMPSGAVESGTQDFALKRGESPGMRYVRFRAWLDKLMDSIPFYLVAYERPHLRGGHATTVLVGLETRVHEICAERGIEHAHVTTSSLKKHATGKGNASKQEMIQVASLLLEREVTSDDEADAVCILVWALEEFGLGAL